MYCHLTGAATRRMLDKTPLGHDHLCGLFAMQLRVIGGKLGSKENRLLIDRTTTASDDHVRAGHATHMQP